MRVEAKSFSDRLMLRLAGDSAKPLTLTGGGGERFTFTDYAYIRIAGDTVGVTARGLSALKLRVGRASPKLVLNGKPATAKTDGDFLIFPAN